MKRIAHLLVFAFLFLYGSASLFVSGNFLGSVCADEEKIVNTATLEDEFEDNKLIVVLKPEFSNFDSIDSNIKEKLLNCGAIEIENLSEFSERYLTVEGELDTGTAYALSEYYSENPYFEMTADEDIPKKYETVTCAVTVE